MMNYNYIVDGRGSSEKVSINIAVL